MPRIAQGLVGLALFIGLGFVTSHYFPQWLEGKLKESQEATAKDMAKWKPVETSFSNVKIDQTMIMPPTYDPSRQPPIRGKR